jgi:putative ABC transport system ATP-binding protein
LGTVRAVRGGAEPFHLSEVVAGPVGAPILRGITAEIPCRGITALAGPSGSGKSTLLRLLNRLDDPTGGSLRWGDRELDEWDPSELRRRVAMVFQRPPVFPGTVLDNLLVASPALDADEAARALERVGLAGELIEREADALSGGEAQRMCFARALLTEPVVVLADEPTASLDGAARRTIEELASSIAADGVPIVWVTHDVEQLRRLADHVIVLIDGVVAAAGGLGDLDGHHDASVRALVGAS